MTAAAPDLIVPGTMGYAYEPKPTKCRWCDVIREAHGIHGHEHVSHPTQYQAAGPQPRSQRRTRALAPKTSASAPPAPAPPKVELAKERLSTSRTKTRPHDDHLDRLLALIDSTRHTPTGQEMYARADARTAAEREQLRRAHPMFRTADGYSAYGASGGRRL